MTTSRALSLTCCLLISLPAAAVMGDKSQGEEEQIKQRIEWFYGQRGILDSGEAALQARRLRQAAAKEIRARDAAAASRRSPRSLWTPVGPSPMTMLGWAMGTVAGRVTAIAVDPTDPSIIYLGGAAGGLWKTTNGGTSWTSLFEREGTQTMGAIAIAPYNHNEIWVGTGDYITSCSGYFGLGIYRSTDGGATFSPRNGSGAATMELTQISDLVLHPTNPGVVIVSGDGICSGNSTLQGGIYYTADAGQSWTKVYTGNAHELERDPSNAAIVYAATSADGVIKSTDGGLTFTPANSGLTFGSRVEIAISPSNPQILYCLSSSGKLYRSTDGAATWQLRNSSACDGQCTYNMTIAVHATDPNTLYRGTVRLFKSTDGGLTHVALTSGWGSGQAVHQDTHVIVRHPTDPNSIFVGSDGGIWQTSDGGATFQNRNANLNMTQFYDIAVHPTLDTVLLGGSQDNSSEAYSGNPIWDVVQVTGDGFVNAINPQNPNYCYIASYPWSGTAAILRSTNGPNGPYNWISSAVNDGPGWVTPYILDPVDPATIYVGSQGIWRSTNNGSSWTNLSGNLPGGAMSCIAVAASDTQVIYAGNNLGRVHRSTDGGATWTTISGTLPNRQVNRIAVDPSDAAHILVVLSGFTTSHVYYSQDGGTTFTAATNGIPDIPANALLILENPYRVYVGTDVGILVSSTDAGPYTTDMNGFPQGVPITDLEYNKNTNTITAGTYGRGAWQRDASAVLPMNVAVAHGPGSTLDSRIKSYRSDGTTITAVDFISQPGLLRGARIAAGDITGGSVDSLLAGPGPDQANPPHLLAYDRTGLPVAGADFFPYGGTGFGVNPSAGDFDADGMDEILTGPGEGPIYGPHVRAFDFDGTGTVTPINVSFYAYGTLRYGVNVAAGNLDADANYDEILTGAGPGAVFGPHIRGFNYDGVRITPINSVSFFAYRTLKFGVNVSGGDVDADGFSEIVTGAGPGDVFGPAVRGFNVDSGPVALLSSFNFFAYSVGKYGAEVTAGDLDGDGFDEVATGPGPDSTRAAELKGFDYDANAITGIPALSLNAWPGTTYGLVPAAANLGY